MPKYKENLQGRICIHIFFKKKEEGKKPVGVGKRYLYEMVAQNKLRNCEEKKILKKSDL